MNSHQLLDRHQIEQPMPVHGDALPLNAAGLAQEQRAQDTLREIAEKYGQTAPEVEYPQQNAGQEFDMSAFEARGNVNRSLVEKAKDAYAKIGQYVLVKMVTGVNPFNKKLKSTEATPAHMEDTEAATTTKEKGWLRRNLRVGAAAVAGAMPFLSAGFAIATGIHLGGNSSGNTQNVLANMHTGGNNGSQAHEYSSFANAPGGGRTTTTTGVETGNTDFIDTDQKSADIFVEDESVLSGTPDSGENKEPGSVFPWPFDVESQPGGNNPLATKEAPNEVGDVWQMPEYKGPEDSVEKLATDQLKSAFEANGLDPNQVNGQQVHDVVEAFMKQNGITNDRMMQVGEYQMIDFKGEIHDIVDAKIKERNEAIIASTPFNIENINDATTPNHQPGSTGHNQAEGGKPAPGFANTHNPLSGNEATPTGTPIVETGDKPKFLTHNVEPDFEPMMLPEEDKANNLPGIVNDQWEMPPYNGPDDSVEALARRHLRATLRFNGVNADLATPDQVQRLVDAFKQQNNITNDRMMLAGDVFNMTDFKKELHDTAKQIMTNNPPKTIGARLNHEPPTSVLAGTEQQ